MSEEGRIYNRNKDKHLNREVSLLDSFTIFVKKHWIILVLVILIVWYFYHEKHHTVGAGSGGGYGTSGTVLNLGSGYSLNSRATGTLTPRGLGYLL